MTVVPKNSPLVIPPGVLQSIGMPEQALKLELAIFFYKEFQLSSGKAARFPGIPRVAFMHELGLCKIAINYDETDARHDVDAGQAGIFREAGLSNPAAQEPPGSITPQS